MIEAHYATASADGAVWTEQVAELRTAEDIDVLIQNLADPLADDAVLTHTDRPLLDSGYPDHEVAIGVRGERGAILFTDGGEGSWVTKGNESSSTAIYAGIELPANCEVPIDLIAAALREFLSTAQRPTAVQWQKPVSE